MIIDGKNAALGRLAAKTTKRLLGGEDIIIVNADRIIIKGNPRQIVAKYIARRQRGSTEKGPYFQKNPSAIVRRAIRGMLPHKTSRGRKAFKKLRVYLDMPEELKGQEIVSMESKTAKSDFLTVGELASSLGWRRE